jgi:hypothetical protein
METEHIDEERRTILTSEFVEKAMEVAKQWQPSNDYILYLVTYKLKDEHNELGKQAPTYIIDSLYLNDQEQIATKQQMYLMSYGDNAQHAEKIPIGSKINLNGPAFKLTLYADNKEESEFNFLATHDHSIVGHYKNDNIILN